MLRVFNPNLEGIMSASAAAPAAEKLCYITIFENRLRETAVTLDTAGKQQKVGLWDALQGAEAVVNALQGRVKELNTQRGSIASTSFDTQKFDLERQLRILEALAAKTAAMDTFFKENMPYFAVPSKFSAAYTVIPKEKVKALYADRGAKIQELHARFNSLLNDRSTPLTWPVTGNYLRDDLDILKKNAPKA